MIETTARASCPSTPGMSDLMRLYDPEAVGADGYPPEWHEVKHLVREAAGYRCVRCGHPYRNGGHGTGEWSPCDVRCTHRGPIRNVFLIEVPCPHPVGSYYRETGCDVGIQARWRILTVHHLDGNKWNLLWWNLASLCQRCHLQIQGKVRLDTPWPWEHSEWFRPFVAGYYAWKHLGLELTREQTDARLDELLDLGARLASVERMPL